MPIFGRVVHVGRAFTSQVKPSPVAVSLGQSSWKCNILPGGHQSRWLYAWLHAPRLPSKVMPTHQHYYSWGVFHPSGSAFRAASYHTSQCCPRKKKAKQGTGVEPVGSGSDEGEEKEEGEADWDDILASDLDDADRLPLGGHRFLVVQPDVRTRGFKDSQGSADLTPARPELRLEESAALVETVPGWLVAERLIRGAREPARKTVFGRGTHRELTAWIRARPEISAVFLSVERLTALQQKELEEAYGVRVYDRYAVVLKIFKEHARTREAKLQIALAEIPYLRSRLRSESDSMDQQRGGQAFIGGGGETFLSVQQRLLREREQKGRRALDRLRQKRALLRQTRARKGYPVVSVVGYTNAGKTSLIRALTGDVSIQPQDQLFATLDVTAHLGCLPNRMPVLYVDTVGFISALPHSLVASFAATLEDVLLSDVIVHVRDVSHPDTESQRLEVLRVLRELGVSDGLMKGMVEVCNKADKLQEPTEAESGGASGLMVSAKQGLGLDRLQERIQTSLLSATDIFPCQLRVPMSGGHLSWLYKETTVTSTEASDDSADTSTMIVNAVMSASTFAKFRAKFGDLRTNLKDR